MKNVTSKKLKGMILLTVVFLISCIATILFSNKANSANAADVSELEKSPNNYTYLVGNVTENEGTVKITNPDIPEIVLGSYRYYYVTDGAGQQYYVADVTSIGDNYLDYGIANIRVFDKDCQFDFFLIEEFTNLKLENRYVLELQYYDEPLNYLYSIYSVISQEIFNSITNDAEPVTIHAESTDELSLKLRESIEFAQTFKTRFYPQEQPQIMPMQGIPSGVSLLDYDGIVKEYYDLYVGQNHFTQGRTTTDNSIVHIIPKTDFKYSGTNKLVIGKEYGYYIRSTSVNSPDVSSEILVFDIDKTIPNPDNFTGSMSVKPLFGGTYYYDRSRDIVSWDNNGGGFGTRLCLANIQISLGLSNVRENGISVPNVGDANYDVLKDIGYYFGDYNFSTCGIGRACDENSFDPTILKTLLQKVKYVKLFAGPVLTAFEKIDQYFSEMPYKDQGFHVSKDTGITLNGIKFSEPNLSLFIKKYNHIPKALNISISNQSVKDGNQFPILYKPFKSNHGMSVTYNLFQPDYKRNIDAQLTSGVTLDIVEDNSGRGFLWIPYGQVDYITTGSYASSDEFIRLPETNRPIFQMTEGQLYRADLVEGMYQEFIYVPDKSSRYVFETIGDYDVHLTLLNSSKTLLTSNDDDGYNTNARLAYNLIGGTTYYVRVKIYNFPSSFDCGSTKLFVRKEAEPVLQESDRENIYKNTATHQAGDAIWRTFQPANSGIYTFTSIGGDTCLELYDQKFNRLAVNDDNRYGSAAIIDLYLKAGQEYHLKTSFWSNSTIGGLSIVVNRLLAMSFEETDGVSEDFSFAANGFAYYRIKPQKSGSYTLSTEAHSSYKDTYMELYNSDFNRITYDDDSGTDRNCLITYYLEAGKTYYIRIRAFSASESCSGRVFFSFYY